MKERMYLPPKRVITAILFSAVGLLTLLMLAPIARINLRSVAASRQVVALDLQPGWWLQPASEPVCDSPPRLALPSGSLQARGARMTGVHALACGDRVQALTSLQEAATTLTDDRSLSLLLASADGRLAHPGNMGENTVPVGWATAVEEATAAYDAGRREEGAAWLDTVQADMLAPASTDRRMLYFSGCYIYRGIRRFSDSLRACQNLVEAAPVSPESWLGLGLTLQQLKRPDEAVSAFERSVELDPGLPAPRVTLGRILAAQGREEEAIAQFEAVTGLSPNEPWSRYFLAAFALEAGDCAEATVNIGTALQYAPSSLSAQVQDLGLRIQEACQ